MEKVNGRGVVVRYGNGAGYDWMNKTNRSTIKVPVKIGSIYQNQNGALFLGHNSSFSVEAHGCIEVDCIYVIDDALEAYVGEDEMARTWDL
ncbi:hypothetical protein RJ640_020183 [Escallonia rubra]|uniref:Uncharacterized protein n=1 Tax=Escallonia rubra TaxID=112253 RepID=A0AA88UWT4_9ASTE|nr:hypothetical protein RJ640_020183 [Escallonia rubra]